MSRFITFYASRIGLLNYCFKYIARCCCRLVHMKESSENLKTKKRSENKNAKTRFFLSKVQNVSNVWNNCGTN